MVRLILSKRNSIVLVISLALQTSVATPRLKAKMMLRELPSSSQKPQQREVRGKMVVAAAAAAIYCLLSTKYSQRLLKQWHLRTEFSPPAQFLEILGPKKEAAVCVLQRRCGYQVLDPMPVKQAMLEIAQPFLSQVVPKSIKRQYAS
jgi:hypothetical protein